MIKDILTREHLTIHFQPIVSISDDRIFACEALLRSANNSPIKLRPDELFKQAKKENMTAELDTFSRLLSIEKFKELYDTNTDCSLFLNFEMDSFLNEDFLDFFKIAEKLNIPPSAFTIEVKEDSDVEDEVLMEKVQKIKSLGASIALDDFGTGYSGMKRLILIKPNLIKLDKSIIQGISQDYVNSSIISALVKMAHKIGTCVLAEGVEDYYDTIKCIESDIELFQGYFFSKPLATITEQDKFLIKNKILTLAASYQQLNTKYRYNQDKVLNNIFDIARKTTKFLNDEFREDKESKIQDFLRENEHLESIYIIDFSTGLQTKDTFTNLPNNKFASFYKRGYNHSAKEYYKSFHNSPQFSYLTDSYVSKKSGKICKTFAVKAGKRNKHRIICFDVVVPSDLEF